MNLLARHHFHAAIHHNDLVERGMAYVFAHIHRVGIAAHLGLGLPRWKPPIVTMPR